MIVHAFAFAQFGRLLGAETSKIETHFSNLNGQWQYASARHANTKRLSIDTQIDVDGVFSALLQTVCRSAKSL